ncbi:LysE family transporter [Flavobacterium agricola]|uniref:LysE family transporter n=1 Tax=Flavobacterium agricola TaxID=2870839 RepID=A0ABY6LX62_9FLAO|nr:LysE family transporter [Flavobacterium agricola]UYW00920.1 LysE family transporter [Flavobacterium agricola]
MFDDILTGIPLGFFLSFMIGPVFFVLLETSITRGVKAALIFDSGVIFADIVFILIAYFTSYKLLERIKDDPIIFIVGGLIMLVYGLISLYLNFRTKIIQEVNKEEIKIVLNTKNYVGYFFKGFALNFINIGVLGFWLGILLTFGPKFDMVSSRLLVFFIAVIVMYFITDLGKIFLAKQLQKKLTAQNILKVKKISSFILIIFGAFLMFQGFFPGKKEILKEKIHQIELIK